MNEQRGPARKPDVRVVAKAKTPKEGQKQYADIGAWWRQEDGRLRGGWDRNIVAVKFADGRVLQVADAFLNLQETATQPAPGSHARAPASPPPPADDFGDDNLPF